MDWADDVTYAVHDLEDFSRAGLIPLTRLRTPYRDDSPLVEDFWMYCRPKLLKNRALSERLEQELSDAEEAAPSSFKAILGGLPAAASGRRLDREIFRSWATDSIDQLTGPDTLSIDSETGVMNVHPDSLLMVEVLKELTWYFVIERPGLASAQRGQARIIRELFVWLITWSTESYAGPEVGSSPSSPRRSYVMRGLPPRLVDYLDIAHWQRSDSGGYSDDTRRISRAVLDFIASLTEDQTVALHERLSGTNVSSMLDDWFNV